ATFSLALGNSPVILKQLLKTGRIAMRPVQSQKGQVRLSSFPETFCLDSAERKQRKQLSAFSRQLESETRSVDVSAVKRQHRKRRRETG
ncbi:MAG: hypothetical protein OXU79_18865, partial [Gemmatimonadota bacterium]|nr:hypothetical protein [Gemmatimonadota bacterium]